MTLFSWISQREAVKPQSCNSCALQLHQSAFQMKVHGELNSFCQVRSLLKPLILCTRTTWAWLPPTSQARWDGGEHLPQELYMPSVVGSSPTYP